MQVMTNGNICVKVLFTSPLFNHSSVPLWAPVRETRQAFLVPLLYAAEAVHNNSAYIVLECGSNCFQALLLK